MKLENFIGKTVLLFGKSRAFSSSEFLAQMKTHNIEVVSEYRDDISIFIEGRMMTPYEQIESEKLYEKSVGEFVSIDELEHILADTIDEDTLLMSLKLSHNKERVKSFIQNAMISDTLFLKLLKLYTWGGEDFFENDDNRDVTAALIRRFYKDIEQNHNVEYATLGLMHLVVQCRDSKLIEAIVSLEPLQKSLKSESRDSKFSIVTAIATHRYSSKSVIAMLIKNANPYVKTLIAMRENSDYNLQNRLFQDGDEDVLEALSYNATLDKRIVKSLFKENKYRKNLAKYIELDDEVFEIFFPQYTTELAQNESLTYELQKRLVALHTDSVRLALASNPHIEERFINELVSEGSMDVSFAIYENESTPQQTLEEAYDNRLNHFALAHNKNTPIKILKLLSESADSKVLEGLAKNESTPVDVLYQLQLDRRFERFVKENPTFSQHIKSENLGWLM